MDHRPFEDWLLADEKLTPRQKQELNLHLQNCRSCSALAEVDLAFRSARPVEPAPGFTARHQVRLASRRQALRRRNVLGFVLLIFSVICFLIGLAWPVLRASVDSPVDLVASWLASLVSLWAALQALLHAGSVLLRVAPGFVPNYIWAIVLFGLGGGSMAWVLSLMKFTRIMQGEK